MMPKALELYKQSDVYKKIILKKFQRKDDADKTRTMEDPDKIAAKARKVVDKEVKIQKLENGQGKNADNKDEVIPAAVLTPPPSPPTVTEQARLV